MMLRFDVAIVTCQTDEDAAILAHPEQFGWRRCPTRWYKTTKEQTIIAILFWGLVEAKQ